MADSSDPPQRTWDYKAALARNVNKPVSLWAAGSVLLPLVAVLVGNYFPVGMSSLWFDDRYPMIRAIELKVAVAMIVPVAALAMGAIAVWRSRKKWQPEEVCVALAGMMLGFWGVAYVLLETRAFYAVYYPWM